MSNSTRALIATGWPSILYSMGAKKLRRGAVKDPADLQPDEKAAVIAMIDPSSPTYGSLTGSLIAVRPNLTYNGAGSRGQRLRTRKQEQITRTAEQWLAACGAGADVRAEQLAAVLTGNYKARTVMTHKAADGSETETTIDRSPSAADVVRAVDVASKVSGDYARQRVAADVLSVELKALARRFAPTRASTQESAEANAGAGAQPEAHESTSQGVYESRQVPSQAITASNSRAPAGAGARGAGRRSKRAPAASLLAPMSEEAPVAGEISGEAPVADVVEVCEDIV